MSKENIASGCKQCPREVRVELQGTKKQVPVGLRGENLLSILGRPAAKHTNGALEALRAQKR